MKRIIFMLLGLFVLAFVVIYGLFKGTRNTGSVVLIPVNYSLSLREFPDTSGWKDWWPWQESDNNQFAKEGTLVVNRIGESLIEAYWKDGSDSLPVLINIMPKGNDSTELVWEGVIQAGFNPIARIKGFSKEKRLNNFMQTVLKGFGIYASNPLNNYGFKPEITMVTDTILITTRSVSDSYPATNTIYLSIDKLARYAGSQKTPITGNPMYQVEKINNRYEMMVALPILHTIPETDIFKTKLMIPGRLILAEVQAGPLALPELYNQFERYKIDHGFKSPAIPYIQMVTNRMQEADTGKWVSRFYYPIFQEDYKAPGKNK